MPADPTDPCPICSRPDAALILSALKEKGERAAHRAAGGKPPRSTFQREIREHETLPPHDAMVAVSARLAHVQEAIASEIPGTFSAGTAIQRLEHLIMRVERLLRETETNTTAPLQSKALLIREARHLIESVAKLSGQLVRVHAHQHHVEVSGPGGGPVQVAAIVEQLPPVVQALHTKAEAGDARAQLLLDRYSRTGEETLDGQLRATRQLLHELEAEA